MYSEEEVEILREHYLENKDVDALSTMLGKSRRSIIGKLSRLGIYEKKVYLTKRGTNPITKLELRDKISLCLEVDCEGLEKAPKDTLRRILEKLEAGL